MKKMWIILGIGLLLGILKATGVIGKPQVLQVAVEAAALHTITETVSASGKIYPENEVKISPDISGEILELYVQEGDIVQQGQLLARIDNSLYVNNVSRANAQVNQSKAGVNNAQAQLQQLRTQLTQAKSNYNRSKQLYADKVISTAEYEQAQTAFDAAEANIKASMENINSSRFNVDAAVASLNEANQNIKRSNLYAPMNGIVSKLLVKKGERVVGTAQMAGTEIMRIAQMQQMKIDVEIGENDIQKIKLNDSAIITVDAYNKKTFKGFVNKIAQSNTSTGGLGTVVSDQVANYTVSILIDPASYADLIQNKNRIAFRPGMSASVDIVTQVKKDVIAVPINAVTTREPDSVNNNDDEQMQEFVFMIVNNKAVQKPVSTLIQDNTYIEIVQGVNKGDKVVIAPYSAIANKLKDKLDVEVVAKDKLFEAQKEEE
jgi:HlyD family secretion protein